MLTSSVTSLYSLQTKMSRTNTTPEWEFYSLEQAIQDLSNPLFTQRLMRRAGNRISTNHNTTEVQLRNTGNNHTVINITEKPTILALILLFHQPAPPQC